MKKTPKILLLFLAFIFTLQPISAAKIGIMSTSITWRNNSAGVVYLNGSTQYSGSYSPKNVYVELSIDGRVYSDDVYNRAKASKEMIYVGSNTGRYVAYSFHYAEDKYTVSRYYDSIKR